MSETRLTEEDVRRLVCLLFAYGFGEFHLVVRKHQPVEVTLAPLIKFTEDIDKLHALSYRES